jgi:hypothetical protein
VELSTLKIAQVHEWWVANDLPDTAAQRGARHWQSVGRAGYWMSTSGKGKGHPYHSTGNPTNINATTAAI